MNSITEPMKFSFHEHSLRIVGVGEYSTLVSDDLGRLKPGIHILG
jgi:hypothetical protein